MLTKEDHRENFTPACVRSRSEFSTAEDDYTVSTALTALYFLFTGQADEALKADGISDISQVEDNPYHDMWTAVIVCRGRIVSCLGHCNGMRRVIDSRSSTEVRRVTSVLFMGPQKEVVHLALCFRKFINGGVSSEELHNKIAGIEAKH